MKILGTIGGVVLLLIGYWYWSMTGFEKEAETHLISPQFRGVVYILFDQANGADKEYEAGRRLYRIPASGVLRTQFKAQTGIVRPSEYYWNYKGRREQIRQRLPLSVSKHNPNGVYVSTEETGTGGCGMDVQGHAKQEVAYSSYIISDEKHFESFYTKLRDHGYTPSDLICDVSSKGPSPRL
jgi:hypothetical protein